MPKLLNKLQAFIDVHLNDNLAELALKKKNSFLATKIPLSFSKSMANEKQSKNFPPFLITQI